MLEFTAYAVNGSAKGIILKAILLVSLLNYRILL